jgi:TonB family protein
VRSLLASVACLSLAGCSDRPPPILGPSHIFQGGQPIPTKLVPIAQQWICPTWHKEVTVELGFTLEPDGSVSHIKVLEESKKGCGYAENAVYAFRQWKFAPYLENGVPVAHESTYRLSFALADNTQ